MSEKLNTTHTHPIEPLGEWIKKFKTLGTCRGGLYYQYDPRYTQIKDKLNAEGKSFFVQLHDGNVYFLEENISSINPEELSAIQEKARRGLTIF